MCTCKLSHFSRVRLFATPRTVARQASLSSGFSRQESWTGLPFPPLGDLPDPGIKPMSPVSPAFQVNSLPLRHWENPFKLITFPHLFCLPLHKPTDAQDTLFHLWDQSFNLLWLLCLPPSPAYHVIFSSLYKIYRRCTFFPSSAVSITVPPILILQYINAVDSQEILQTVTLSFLQYPHWWNSLWDGSPNARFLHEFSVMCPVSYGLFLFPNHRAKMYLTLCSWRCLPGFYIMPSVLHVNLSNILLDFSTWVTYEHLKLDVLYFLYYL